MLHRLDRSRNACTNISTSILEPLAQQAEAVLLSVNKNGGDIEIIANHQYSERALKGPFQDLRPDLPKQN